MTKYETSGRLKRIHDILFKTSVKETDDDDDDDADLESADVSMLQQNSMLIALAEIELRRNTRREGGGVGGGCHSH